MNRKLVHVIFAATILTGCGATSENFKYPSQSNQLTQPSQSNPSIPPDLVPAASAVQPTNTSANLAPGLYRIQPSGGVVHTASGQYCSYSTWGGLVALTDVRSHNLENLPTLAKEYLEKTLTFVGDCVPTVNGFASGIFRTADYKLFYKVTYDQWCFYKVTYNTSADQNPNVPRMPDGSLNYPILSRAPSVLQWTGSNCPAG